MVQYLDVSMCDIRAYYRLPALVPARGSERIRILRAKIRPEDNSLEEVAALFGPVETEDDVVISEQLADGPHVLP
jgi:hypothetical protein